MDKLQKLQQKTVSVEEYKHKMELYMTRASIRESKPTTIVRFLSGLNLEIRDSDESQVKEVFIKEGRGNSPSHLKFFLLVFSKLKEDIK